MINKRKRAAKAAQRILMTCCPKCGNDADLRHIEDCVIERRVRGVDAAGALVVDGFYTTEGWDEASGDGRLFCPECATEFPIPKDLEVEFV